MNIKTKAAIYTLILLLWTTAIIGITIKYPEIAQQVLVGGVIIGGIVWLYKLILYVLESK